MKKNGHKKRQRPLTQKQEAWCQAYVKLITDGKESGVEACKIAGYKGTYGSLKVQAHDNLTNPILAARVQELKALTIVPVVQPILSAHDVLVGMSARAKADIADVFEIDGSFDLQKAKARGVSWLIKKITRDKSGFITGVELHNGQAAMLQMGKYWRLWDRGGYGGIEDDADKARALLAKLLRVDPKQLPPANPNDVEGELVIDEDTTVEMKNEQ